MNVLSLFAGIGGLELGLERAGMTVIGQVEIDTYCRRVLAKHWPEVPRHEDVRTCVDWWRSEPRPRVDLVCGGFPCQPVSVAGRQLAQDDERWLWPETWTVIRALRPRWVLLENVPGLLGRGFGDVVGDLAAGGYDTEWDCIPAAAVGAPHLRYRVFVVAYSLSQGSSNRSTTTRRGQGSAFRVEPERLGSEVANANRVGRDRGARVFRKRWWRESANRSRWAIEPDVGRVAHGIPGRVDRIRSLGNAVVPQVAEHVGRLILDADAREAA